MRPFYVLQIARFTLKEAVSRRLILAGIIISLGYVGLFAIGFHFAVEKAIENTPDAQSRVAIGVAFATLAVLGIYVANNLAAFLALFLSVGAVSSEVDAGTLHAVLARPLRRSEFIIGRWLGYLVLLAAYISGMLGLMVVVARWISGYEVPDPAHAWLLMLLECAVLLTMSLLGSALMPTLANGIVVFTLLGLAWLGGMIEFVGRLLPSGGEAMLNVGTAVSLLLPSDALWR